MGVIGAGVDLQLAELLHAQGVPGSIPLTGAADHFLRPALEEVAEGLLLVALGKPLWRMYSLVSRLSALTAMRDAFRTITWSPESRLGW
jgi:hypothetical protein